MSVRHACRFPSRRSPGSPRSSMRRLYLQFYIGIVVILVIFVVAVGFLWRVVGREARLEDKLAVAGELATARCRRQASPRTRSRTRSSNSARVSASTLSLYAPDGTLIASAGRRCAARSRRSLRARVRARPARPRLAAAPARRPFPGGASAWRSVARREHSCCSCWSLVGDRCRSLGAYPVARRLTRRLERLKAGVEQLGEGDLSARVQVEGRDEVASLAESFNQSASRVAGTDARAQDVARQLLARAAHAADAHQPRAVACRRQNRPQRARRAQGGHRRARSTDRRAAAGEPA